MRAIHPLLALLLAATTLAACASSNQVRSPSSVEIIFGDSRPGRAFDEIGEVRARHFSVQDGVRMLQTEAHELGADAVIGVEYGEFFPQSGRGVTTATSDPRANEGYSTVMLEFIGIAVKWVDEEE